MASSSGSACGARKSEYQIILRGFFVKWLWWWGRVRFAVALRRFSDLPWIGTGEVAILNDDVSVRFGSVTWR
jgi:hypothetical protein